MIEFKSRHNLRFDGSSSLISSCGGLGLMKKSGSLAVYCAEREQVVLVENLLDLSSAWLRGLQENC